MPSPIPLDDGVPQLAGKRILVVDDNATNREIVTRHARSWGMEPVAVELAAEALALLEAREPFDVAALDMMMPEMDGLGLAKEIRRRRSEQDLPLVLLTSLGRMPEAQLDGIFSAQLSKPFKASQLYNTLVHLLTTGRREEEPADVPGDGRQAMSSLRILLAEDNAMNQKVALRLLERLGYRADVASNGLEALAALERQPYDVVLMDVQMPELDGLDAARRICARWPPERRPHIVAMTANALPEDRDACFAAGMNDYVAKPIRGDELAAALKGAQTLRDRDAGPQASEISLDGCRAPEPARPWRRGVPRRGDRRVSRGCAGTDHKPPEHARAAGHRGATPSGAHAEVKRLDAGRGGVRGALPHRRAARQRRSPRRRLRNSLIRSSRSIGRSRRPSPPLPRNRFRDRARSRRPARSLSLMTIA